MNTFSPLKATREVLRLFALSYLSWRRQQGITEIWVPDFLFVGNICKVTNILPHLPLTVFGTTGFCLRPPRFALLCEMQSWKYVLCVKSMGNGPLLTELVFLECNFYLVFPTQFSNLEIWMSFCATFLTQSI